MICRSRRIPPQSARPQIQLSTSTRVERRSALRPHVVAGWRKFISPSRDQRAQVIGTNGVRRVHVWIAQTKSLLGAQSALKLLSDEDWTSILRLRVPAARHSATAAKIVLRLGLSRAVDRQIAPRDWSFYRTAHGRPLVNETLPNINFSVSHTDDVVVVAVAPDLNVGVDVEGIDRDLNGNVVATFCHSEEQRALTRLPRQQRVREFIRLWTHKEAFTKMMGLGHTIDFASINGLSLASQRGIRSPSISSDSSVHIETFYVPVDHSHYHASLAVQIPDLSVAPVEVQLINVAGPDATRCALTAAVCN